MTTPKAVPVNDILQWDVQSWSPALNYWEEHISWNPETLALELGGRQGGLSLWLALKGIRVICSDLSGARLTAEPLHQRYGVTSLITYEDIDATSIPYENHFDLIVFKSIIGGIGRNNQPDMQRKVFNEILKALKPGGKLLFAENLSASPIHRFLRRKFIKWGGYWRYVTLQELKEFMQDFNSLSIESTGVIAAFGRSESQRGLLSHIDAAVLNQLSPRNWRYIGYGIAEKRN
jgi:SAM-dependent methyltransferase